MAQITSLDYCFNYHTEYPKVSKLIQDLIDRVTTEAKELKKNEQYYGTKTFSCEEYKPIELKMKEIDQIISLLISELIEAKKALKKSFYMKNKQDLTDYITYLNTNYLTDENERNYTGYKNAESAIELIGGPNNPHDGYGVYEAADRDIRVFRSSYLIYKEYLPYRNKAEQKLSELERIYNSTAEG